MIQLCIIIISLVAVIVEIFSILWGWVILCLPIAFVLVVLLSVKIKRWKNIPELSERANSLFQKYGHYYIMPFAGRDFSSSASTIMFAGVLISIVGAIRGFWWGILIAFLNWLVMGNISKMFNPTVFLTDPQERAAHEEVITYLQRKMLK